MNCDSRAVVCPDSRQIEELLIFFPSLSLSFPPADWLAGGGLLGLAAATGGGGGLLSRDTD